MISHQAQNNRLSLVLSGGGALGAYEAGVIQYVATRIVPTLPQPAIGHIAGTSIGAINAAFVAAASHQLEGGMDHLMQLWRELTLNTIIPIRTTNILRLLYQPGMHRYGRREGLADPTHFIETVVHRIPWLQKRRNLKRGHYLSLSVPTTRIRDGLSEIFYESADPDARLHWASDEYTTPTQARIGPSHVLCSSAFPFLFPPGRLGDEYYTDGGIRYNTPLSPVLRFGAQRMLVVCLDNKELLHESKETRIDDYNTPLYLGGKMLQALLADQAENDLKTAAMFNDLLAAGQNLYGDQFVQQFQAVTARSRGAPIHPARILTIRPSEHVGGMARDAARRILKQRRLPFLQARLLGWLSDTDDSDLLSVMLLDGAFTGDLIRLGINDARDNHDAILDTIMGPLLENNPPDLRPDPATG